MWINSDIASIASIEYSTLRSFMKMAIPHDRIIIHLVSLATAVPAHQPQYLTCRHRQDYDCFYASVFEAADPSLKHRPLGVQQKQILVTCNYEARRRGLRKLQLIRDARRICPDVVVRLGEDLEPFREASKALYAFVRGVVQGWGDRVEKLGLDEV